MRELLEAAATAAFHNFVNTPKNVIVVCLLGFLVIQVTRVSTTDADCNFNSILEPENTYYVYNPEYPRVYSTPRSCKWRVRGSHRIRLSCGNVSLPCTNDCAGDNIAVSIGKGIVNNHCGTNWFIEQSMENEMNITFTAQSTYSGYFLCALQVITPEDNSCTCGMKNPTRIVGGTETGVNEYPMMAGLVDTGQLQIYCGATIISQKHVLTAAHCLVRREPSNLGVLVGEHDIRTGNETNATRLFRISKVYIHPQYVESSFDYDVGIVMINGKIEYTGEVGPVCLPFVHSLDSFVGDFLTVLGWGTLEYGGEKSDVLQKVTLSVISHEECIGSVPETTKRQLCTSAKGKDSCQFDSGGPLLWLNPTMKSLTLAAMVSTGGVCGAELPGVNQRVGSYLGWIMDVTSRTGVKYCING